MKLTISTTIAILAALALGACSTQPGTIFRSLTLDDGKSFTTGARQRLISNHAIGVASRPGRVDPERIVCVEPSPDVAIAVANSFGAGISILGQGSGSISGAQAEGIAQLAERTVAIQALLNKGYQACLDYANGAITGTQYSLRTSRLDDLMVTLILAEVAGGEFGRSGAAIGTKASAQASAKLVEGLREDFDMAKAKLDKANENVADKEAALAEAETELAKMPDDKGLQVKKETANKALKVAKAERDTLLQLMTASAATAAQAAAEINEVIALGGLTPKLDAAIAKELGAMQARFIEKDISQDFISTCLIELGLWKDRNEFDNQFTRHALMLLKENKKGITDETIRDFFLGTQIGGLTQLTKYCQTNLKDFIDEVRIDNQTARLKKLEIESKRLDLLSRRSAAETAKPAAPIHPLTSYKLLVEDHEALKAHKAKLDAVTIPAAGDVISPEDRQKLAVEQSALSQFVKAALAQAANALSAPEKGKVDQVEISYISIVTDTATARNGTPSVRKLWRLRFEEQQAIARRMVEEFGRYSKKLNDLSEEISAFIKLVSYIK